MKYFNFNNEEYLLPIVVNPDKSVDVNTEGQTLHFETLQDLAESYAVARNVQTENLKSWVLLEEGDIYSFVLKAATAGLDDDDYEDCECEDCECEDCECEEEEDPLESAFLRIYNHSLSPYEYEALFAFCLDYGVDPQTFLDRGSKGAHKHFQDYVKALQHWKTEDFYRDQEVQAFYDAIQEGTYNTYPEITDRIRRQLKMSALARRSFFPVYYLSLAEKTFTAYHLPVDAAFVNHVVFDLDGHPVLVKRSDLPRSEQEEAVEQEEDGE